jgi:hypothetical protein
VFFVPTLFYGILTHVAGGQVDQLMVYAHKAALCAARNEQLAAAATAAGASTQLLSLLLSCLKYCSNAISSEPASCLESLEVAWLAAKAAVQLDPASASPPSSSSSSSVNDSTHAALVAARSLHLTSRCFAVMLKVSAALATADVRIGAKMPQQCTRAEAGRCSQGYIGAGELCTAAAGVFRAAVCQSAAARALVVQQPKLQVLLVPDSMQQAASMRANASPLHGKTLSVVTSVLAACALSALQPAHLPRSDFVTYCAVFLACTLQQFL